MPDQPGPPSPADRLPGDAADPESLASALVALQDAVDELSRTAGATEGDTAPPSPAPGAVEPPPAASPSGEPVSEHPDERDSYIQSLERRGALVDVDASEDGEIDWAALPPAATHVRFRDGRVQRIGFT